MQHFARNNLQSGYHPLPNLRGRCAHLQTPARQQFDLRSAKIIRPSSKTRVFICTCQAPNLDVLPAIFVVSNRFEGLAYAQSLPFRLDGFETGYQADAFFKQLAGVSFRTSTQGILEAQGHWVYPQLRSQIVHGAFNRKCGLHDPKTTESTRGGVIGVGGVTIGSHVGDNVRAAGMGGGTGHHLITQRGIGTGIAVKLGFSSQQSTVLTRAKLDADGSGVALGVHQHAFAPGEEQFDWAASGLGQQGGMNLPGNILFAAKAASSALSAHTYSGFR